MVTQIACDSLGFQELGTYHYVWADEPTNVLFGRVDGIVASLQHGDIVVMQYPTWEYDRFTNTLIREIKSYGAHLFFFIQDLRSQMSIEAASFLPTEINTLNQAEVVITHSDAMSAFLKQNGLTAKTISLHMMDHPVTFDLGPRPKYRPVITYAGITDDTKAAAFIQNWDNQQVKLRIYCNGQKPANANYLYAPWQNSDAKLLYDLRENAGFGLVWASDPTWQNYMQMNATFKLSTYLAAGIPVIANKDITQHRIIEEKHLGILVDSLAEAQQKVAALGPAEYDQMVDSIAKFSTLIRNGEFTKRALTEAIFNYYY